MNSKLEQKINQLPLKPGVYFFFDSNGKIIYIGKAIKLKNRVKQYFGNIKLKDLKTRALVAEIADLKWMEVDTELEALFLEAEMVKRYLPRFNILLRDDRSVNYIRIDYNSSYPTVSLVRHPPDDNAKYFGPYLNTFQIKLALKYLRRIFPYSIKKTSAKRVNLDYFLGLDPGLEEQKVSLKKYRANLRKLISVIEGKQKQIEHQIETNMKKAALKQDYEKAATYRNQLMALTSLNNRVKLGLNSGVNLKKDDSLINLKRLLGLASYLKRIEGYDISHMQGTNVVASMIVFQNGISEKTSYRKFKTTIDQNNDFSNMREIILRRFSQKNLAAWGVPDLVLIDGGKGQLDAAISARNISKVINVPFIGLAKKSEQIVVQINRSDGGLASLVNLDLEFLKQNDGTLIKSDNFLLINISHDNPLLKLLQRIRDESHRFAVSYHTVLKRQESVKSILDDIPGIGKTTRLKILRKFGSVKKIQTTTLETLSDVVGPSKAKIIKKYLENHTG